MLEEIHEMVMHNAKKILENEAKLDAILDLMRVLAARSEAHGEALLKVQVMVEVQFSERSHIDQQFRHLQSLIDTHKKCENEMVSPDQ
ncbi:Hypothetical protein, putative [Bodo saltans]|uniref:Uncharacterized protein n=1 Tax=Bodo saltans TaxID=75058 RepID=A0A0S4J0B7_BODSA|nr:Hypothetical protein, putative [Bodo saltans]|eukprot:CUG75162.1 Hypothetical protein, putative [Bodo saltans]